MTTVRIFFSSPGDVKMERETARRIVARLQSEIGNRAILQPYFWEHEAMLATKDYQQNIPQMADFDIVVCVLWSRLGTPLDPARHPKPEGGGYASGTEYEFVTAMHAHQSRGTPDIFVFRNLTEPRRPSRPRELRESIDREIDRLDSFFDTYFQENQFFTRAINVYSTLGEFEEKLSLALRSFLEGRLGQATAIGIATPPAYQRPPYLGLAAFDFQDAPVFFGRTAQVGQIISAFQTQEMEAAASTSHDFPRFVLILGSSGSGKSSLARAGVLPMLVNPGVIEGTTSWRHAIFKPTDTSSANPALALLTALTQSTALPELIADATTTPEILVDQLIKQPQAAALLIHQALTHAGATQTITEQARLRERLAEFSQSGREEDARLLQHRIDTLSPSAVRLAILADQLEEVFTSQVPPESLSAFLQILDSLARSGRVFILATLRSDFYPKCLEHPVLVKLMQGTGTYPLPAPSPADISQMIRQPAAVSGLTFEENPSSGEKLDDLLRDAALKDPSALPLLSYTLEQLHHQRNPDGTLTLSTYHALGGLEGAIGSRAETVFSSLPPEAQSQFDSLWKQLVTLSEDSEPTRRRAPLDSLESSPHAQSLINALVNARLLVTDQSHPNQAPTVSVAHEALLRHWPRLSHWIQENRQFLRSRSRLAAKLVDWIEHRKSDDYLIPRGPALAEAEAMLAQYPLALDTTETEFVSRSISAVRRRDQRRLRNARLITIGALTLALIAIATGILALKQKRTAQDQRTIALQQKQIATSSAQRATASEARTSYLLGVESLEHNNTRQGIASLAQSLTIDPSNRSARDRLYSRLLYGLPRPIPIRSISFDPGETQARQRLTGGLLGPAQRLVSLSDERSVEVFDLNRRTIVPGPWEQEPDSFATVISHTSTHLMNIRSDLSVRFFGIEDASASSIIQTRKDFSNLMGSSDGRLFVEALNGGKVTVYDTSTAKPLHSWSQKGSVDRLMEDGNRNILAVSANEIITYDRKNNTTLPPYSHPDSLLNTNMSRIPAGTTCLVLPLLPKPGKSPSQSIVFLDSSTFKPIQGSRTIIIPEGIIDLCTSDHATLIAASFVNGSTQTYHQTDGQKDRSYPLPIAASKLALSPNHQLLAAATPDGTVHLFDTTTAKPAFDPISHDARLEDLGISWDGRHLLTSTDRVARIWDLAVGNGLLLHANLPTAPWSTHTIPNTQSLLVSSTEGLLSIDLKTLKPNTQQPSITSPEPIGRLVSEDTSAMAVLVKPDTIDFYKTSPPESPHHATFTAPGTIDYWATSRDGSLVAVIASAKLHIIQSADGKPLPNNQVIAFENAPPTIFQFSPDNRFLAAIIPSPVENQQESTLLLRDLRSARTLSVPLPPLALYNLSFRPDGAQLAIQGLLIGQSSRPRCYLISLGQPESRPVSIPLGGIISQISYSRDSEYLGIATYDQSFQVHSATDGSLLAPPLVLNSGSINQFALSPTNPAHVAILTHNQSTSALRIWNWRDLTPVSQNFPFENLASHLAYSGDGTLIHAISPDPNDSGKKRHFLTTWDAETPPEIAPLLITFAESATASRFSPGGPPKPADPFERIAHIRNTAPDNWFLRNPADRTITPASQALTAAWFEHPYITFSTFAGAMPAVPHVHAAIAYWQQSSLKSSETKLAAMTDQRSDEAKFLSSQIESSRARIRTFLEFASRSSATDKRVSYFLSLYYQNIGSYLTAAEHSALAYEASPDDLDVLRVHAYNLEAIGKRKKAIPILRKLTKLAPGNVGHIFRLAVSLHLTGESPEAKTLLLKVYQNPELDSANRAYAYIVLGKNFEALALFVEAAEEIKKSSSTNSYNLNALVYLIVGHHYAGNTGDAVKFYQQLIAAEPRAADPETVKALDTYPEFIQAMLATIAQLPASPGGNTPPE